MIVSCEMKLSFMKAVHAFSIHFKLKLSKCSKPLKQKIILWEIVPNDRSSKKIFLFLSKLHRSDRKQTFFWPSKWKTKKLRFQHDNVVGRLSYHLSANVKTFILLGKMSRLSSIGWLQLDVTLIKPSRIRTFTYLKTNFILFNQPYKLAAIVLPITT